MEGEAIQGRGETGANDENESGIITITFKDLKKGGIAPRRELCSTEIIIHAFPTKISFYITLSILHILHYIVTCIYSLFFGEFHMH
jgi:hypothetical protein